jgi:hypothetical protein
MIEQAVNRAIMESLKIGNKTPHDRAKQRDAEAHIDGLRQMLKPSRRLC